MVPCISMKATSGMHIIMYHPLDAAEAPSPRAMPSSLTPWIPSSTPRGLIPGHLPSATMPFRAQFMADIVRAEYGKEVEDPPKKEDRMSFPIVRGSKPAYHLSRAVARLANVGALTGKSFHVSHKGPDTFTEVIRQVRGPYLTPSRGLALPLLPTSPWRLRAWPLTSLRGAPMLSAGGGSVWSG